MSFGNFASFVKTPFGARLVRASIAAALAAGIVCAAAASGHAATTGLATVPFLPPVLPAGISQSTATSFKERFDVVQTSRTREILASLAYYVPETELTTASLPRRQKIVSAGAAIVGTASTYNPTDPKEMDAGGEELASGEKYDANDWTAAIRTDLRAQFGGVRFGKNYRPAFALVQSNDKQLIVRINDIGPLRRGRIIDLNARAMRYFDPTMKLGLIGKVSVTPLAGQDLALGPIGDDRPVNFASRFDQAIR